MKSHVRGFGVLEILFLLACIGGLIGTAIYQVRSFHNEEQAAYDSAKNEAIKIVVERLKAKGKIQKEQRQDT